MSSEAAAEEEENVYKFNLLPVEPTATTEDELQPFDLLETLGAAVVAIVIISTVFFILWKVSWSRLLKLNRAIK